MPLNPGDTLLDGRYRILRLLGQGAAGAVYRARDAQEGQDVAIRELPAEATEDEVMPRAFLDAASAILHLSHRRLVRTRDAFSEGDHDYLVMDYVAGGSLDDRLRDQSRLLVPEAVRIGIEVCEGLRYAHRHGVYHGHLKPSDILFDIGRPSQAAAAVKIGGLGLGHLIEAQVDLVDLPASSLPYVAPEKLEGAPDDPRVDVYALGAVLYRLVAGCHHLEEGEGQASRERDFPRLLEQPPPPSSHNPRVPAWLDGVILRSLARDPEDRFPTANELRMALLEHRPARGSARLAGGAGSQPASTGISAPQPKRRWLWPVATAVLLLLVTLGAIAPLLEWGPWQPPALAPDEEAVLVEQPRMQESTLEATQVVSAPAAISPENVERLTERARWGQGVTEALAYAPDGTLLAIASSLGVSLLDATTLAQVMFLETPQWAHSVAFSPDSALLAAGLADGTLNLWEVADGKLGTVFAGHTDAVPSLAFSPGGALLASASLDGQARLWRVADGTVLHILEGHEGPVWQVAFSPDGETLASGSDDTFRLWQVSDGSLRDVLEAPTGGGMAVAFSPGGETLATGSDDAVRLWRAADGTFLRSLEGHSLWINDLAFSPDGETLASASADESVRLWQVADGQLLHSLDGHMAEVNSLAFSPDGRVLATASTDEGVLLWDSVTGQLLASPEGSQAGVEVLALSPDGATLASGSGGAVQLRSVSDGTPVGRLEGHGDWVRALAYSPDGSILASGSDDQTVRLWGTDRYRLLDTFTGHGAPVWTVAFSPDGALLASGDDGAVVRLWRVGDGELVAELSEHMGRVSALAFSPDGTTLASGADDGLVKLWRVSDGQLQGTLVGPDDTVWSLAFSPDGTLLASGPADGMARLWRVADGTSFGTLDDHDDFGLALAFSPDGELLATAGANGVVYLWRVVDQALLASLQGHRAGIGSLVFSPDGSLLISGSYDGTVRQWGVPSE